MANRGDEGNEDKIYDEIKHIKLNCKNRNRHELIPIDDEYMVIIQTFLSYAGPFLYDVITNINTYKTHCIHNNITPVKQMPMYFSSSAFPLVLERAIPSLATIPFSPSWRVGKSGFRRFACNPRSLFLTPFPRSPIPVSRPTLCPPSLFFLYLPILREFPSWATLFTTTFHRVKIVGFSGIVDRRTKSWAAVEKCFTARDSFVHSLASISWERVSFSSRIWPIYNNVCYNSLTWPYLANPPCFIFSRARPAARRLHRLVREVRGAWEHGIFRSDERLSAEKRVCGLFAGVAASEEPPEFARWDEIASCHPGAGATVEIEASEEEFPTTGD